MTFFQIEVWARARQHDIQAHQLARELQYLSPQQLPSLHAIVTDQQPLLLHTAQLYLLTGTCTPLEIDQLTTNLLLDPIVQEVKGARAVNNHHIVDVFFLPGVTDTLAESVIAGAHMLGISGLEHVATGRRYLLDSRLSAVDVRTITEALLYNPVIQYYALYPSGKNVEAQCIAPTPVPTGKQNNVGTGVGAIHCASIPLSTMTDEALLEVSKQGLLALNLDEMCTIQRYYREQGREPTAVELETLAQTWSEHCSHKTFKATIAYRELDNAGNVLTEESINGLLKHYIMRATEQVKRSDVVSAFSDNAGIVRFTETHDIAFKVETHNHPSAIEPFGGANTGVGGVIRDVLGVSAQPIACTDVLCFGPPDTPVEELLPGILSPRRIASGVVNGVRDYGNKMGIPTVNGAVLYHAGYVYNPLVFCGCLGILPHGSHPHKVQPSHRIVVLGGRTGRDGIHGATFSSGEMSSEINAQAGSAVQIGAPITEKKLADVIIQARDRWLYSAITDCGAGGFSSAIGEMGAETGAHVELEKAPLKYQGLAPWEIWLSEAQERMVLAVPPEHIEELLEICAIEEVEASIIGTFTGNHRLTVTYADQIVADLDMQFLHDGRPGRTLEAEWVRNEGKASIQGGQAGRAQGIAPTVDDRAGHLSTGIVGVPLAGTLSGGQVSLGCDPPSLDTNARSFSGILLSLLRHPNIASKEAVVRRYDHEVQGATVLKPLVGRAGNGPGDAAVLQPILNGGSPSQAGIVLSNGVNPLYGKIDPYHMATNAVDEALRNLTAVGGDIEQTAILDNFCWGNPNDPAQLGMLVRAVKGCHDAAIGFGVPFISGKDSLNNEYRSGGKRLPVLPTLLISAVGRIDDAATTIDMSLKTPGNLLYLVGTTREEMGGSHYAEVVGRATFESLFPYAAVPQVHIAHAYISMKALGAAIRMGLVRSCHDCSEGGLAVALAEMAIAGSSGIRVDLGDLSQEISDQQAWHSIQLFSESASRFIVEIAPEDLGAFEKHMRTNGVEDVKYIGIITNTEHIDIHNRRDELIYLSLAELQDAWKGGQA